MTHAHSTESVQIYEPDCCVRAVYMTDATGNYGRENKLHSALASIFRQSSMGTNLL